MYDTTITKRPARNAWTLALAGLGTFMSALDVVVVSTALPTLQTRLGASLADLRILVWMAMPMVIAPIAGALADKVGNKPFMVAGLVLQAAGLGWLAVVAGPGTGYGTLVAPLITAGIGIAMCFPTVANLVTGSVPQADVGVAAGTNNALNALGGVFGIAILAAIFAARGGYATPATFIDGFRPAEWAAAAAAAIGVIAALLAQAGLRPGDRITLAPGPAPAGQAA
jgi:MFS family permease